MKKTLTATAVALFSLAPALSSADCGGHDAAASAEATPPSQLAATPAPAATKAPTATASKAPAVKAAKQAADKTKEAAPDAKVAVVSMK
jgi:hypothetical protein